MEKKRTHDGRVHPEFGISTQQAKDIIIKLVMFCTWPITGEAKSEKMAIRKVHETYSDLNERTYAVFMLSKMTAEHSAKSRDSILQTGFDMIEDFEIKTEEEYEVRLRRVVDRLFAMTPENPLENKKRKFSIGIAGFRDNLKTLENK